MKCFLDNLQQMRLVAEETQRKYLTERGIYMLWNIDLVEKVKKEVNTLNPLCEYIDYVQSNKCTLADAVHKWINTDLVLGHFIKWQKRDKMICDTTGLLAYALHPTYKGANLSNSQWDTVKNYIYRRGETIYQQFEKFLQGDDGFGDEILLQTKPDVYWKTMQIQFPLISDIALSYMHLPAATADLERVFSMWSYVHNKTRNRLSSKTSENLIFIYHAIKTMDPLKLKKIYL